MKILIMLTRGGAQARRAEKNFFGGRAPPLSQGLDGHPQPIPPPQVTVTVPSDSDSDFQLPVSLTEKSSFS